MIKQLQKNIHLSEVFGKNRRMLMKIMLSYAFSFALIDLADTISIAIDGLIVSRGISSTALAAIGISDPTYKAVSLFCGVFAMGIRYVCSSYMVNGDRKKNNEVFTFGCTVIAVIAVITTAAGFLFTKQICFLLGVDGSDPELYSNLIDYLHGWFTGIPGLICFLVLSPIVTLDGNKKCVTAATVLQSTLNIAGDVLSTFVLKAGTLGIGLSTGLAFDAAAVLLIFNFFRKHSLFRLRFSKPKIKEIGSIFSTGLPGVTKYACKMLLPLVVNRIVLSVGGSDAIAAMTIKTNIAGFCLIVGSGIAESVSLMGALFYHEKDKNSLKVLMQIALINNLLFNFLLSVLLFAASPLVARAFVETNSTVYPIAVMALRFFALSLLLNGINAIMISFLQSTNKLTLTHIYTAFFKFLSLAVSMALLSRIYGINGLFYSIPVSEAVTLLLYILFVLINRRGSGLFDAFLMIKKDFGYSEENSIYINVTNMAQVINISEKISVFCVEHGIDKRRAFFASLCMEELAGNVVNHGFNKDDKPHTCNIRVIIEGEDITMRIRDDCVYFNLKERFEAADKADKFSNIGIRLVFGIAKEIKYINLIETNTIIIKL